MQKLHSTKTTDILIIAFAIVLILISALVSNGQVRDTTICHDTTFTRTVKIKVDSSVCVTYTLPSVEPELRGFYVAYDAFTLGSATSENTFLAKMKSLGVNMLNYYARAKLYTSADRDKLAAFVKKAKEQYGIVLITVDVRLTNSSEYPGWVAYYQKYVGTVSMIEPLTEIEPYNNTGTSTAPVYDYNNFFTVCSKMDALTKQYGAVLNFYEGWIGKNYSNKQAAVDSMVLHCGRIFISNYVSMTRYAASIWDGSMTNRIDAGGSDYGGIALSCEKFAKKISIVEIQSIEDVFLLNYYSCPESSTKKCKPFYGTTWDATKTKFNSVSSARVLKWVKLTGKTIFYSKLLPLTNQ